MSTPKRTDSAAELGRLEDALVDSILQSSETELREEITAAGEDADAILRRVDALIVSVKTECKLARLRAAQEEVQALHGIVHSVTTTERTAARARFDKARSQDSSLSKKLLLAARNGQGATGTDLDSLADDYAELERLEQGAGDPSS